MKVRTRTSTRSRARRDPDSDKVKTLDRLIEHAERELRQMKAAVEKYAFDHRRYAPQLENVASSAASIGTSMRAAYRIASGRPYE